jgi:Sulfotransferase family
MMRAIYAVAQNWVGSIRSSLRQRARRSPQITTIYRRMVRLYHKTRIYGLGVRESPDKRRSINPTNMVWIFGSGRSGSTWLRSIMGEMDGCQVWEEPMVGRLFGEFYETAREGNLRSKDFVMGEPIRRGWIQSVRNFVLDAAYYSHSGLRADEYLVVKKPNGSVGASLLMEALPESRMLLLIRDPRDVVASALDGARRGGWMHEWRGGDVPGKKNLADERPNAFVRQRANSYRRSLAAAKKAYDAHEGPKVLVRYENLRTDTLGTLRRVYAELEIPAREEDLARAVQKYSWENIPKEEKGSGKFYRKGVAAGWKEDLTSEQVRIVEEVTAPLLRAFYPGSIVGPR